MRRTFRAPEVSCAHCKNTIESGLRPLHGVEDATVDVDAKTVEVHYDEDVIDSGRLVETIEAAGYDVDR